MKKIVFPGSFDPFTVGHKAIVDRCLNLAEEVVIAIGVNENKKSMLSPQERKESIEKVYVNDNRVKVITYSCLTTQLCKELDINIIARGVRSVKDFEYERDIADVNKMISGVETIFLFAEPEYAAISSSMVKELKNFGENIEKFLP